MERALEAELRGLARGERDFGVIARVINCSLRHYDPAISVEIARLLGGVPRPRASWPSTWRAARPAVPPGVHRAAFDIAADGLLGITVHAGEAAGAESIAEAVHHCHADRIGHGTRLYEDPRLRDYVRDRRIPLEINITSNVQTRAVPRAAEHPVRDYFDAGLTVTLCTDGWLMCGVSLTDEYWLAHTELGFTREEIDRMILNGFESAFLPGPSGRAGAAGGRRAGGAFAESRISPATPFLTRRAGMSVLHQLMGSDRLRRLLAPAGPRRSRCGSVWLGAWRWCRRQAVRRSEPSGAADQAGQSRRSRRQIARRLVRRRRASRSPTGSPASSASSLILGIGVALSQQPPAIRWRVVAWGLGLQLAVRHLRAADSRGPGALPLAGRLRHRHPALLLLGSEFVFGELGKPNSQPRRDLRLPDPAGDHLRLRAVRHHVLPRHHAAHRARLRRA